MDVKRGLTVAWKSLVHGLAFAFLAYTANLLWTRIFGLYQGLNAWLVLIGLLVVIGIGFGFLNSLLMYVLWLPVERGWKTHLGQALILFPIVLVLDLLPLHFLIPVMADFAYLDYLAAFVLVNLLYALLDGYVGMRVGIRWKVRGLPQAAQPIPISPEPEIPPDNPDGVRCPRCGGTNLVVASDRSAYCIDCKRGLRKELFGTST